MAFTDKQRRALRAKLNYRNVKSRLSQGATIAYVEGWHVISEANRIFGYDNWDRQTQSPQCIWSDTQRTQTACIYSTKVRISVRAGETLTLRDGIGTGFGRSSSPELAHEMALKAAETDATKRALATFGNPFGLALYDKEQAHVTKPPNGVPHAARTTVAAGKPIPLILKLNSERDQEFDEPESFAVATLKAVNSLQSLGAVYAFWEDNMASLVNLRAATKATGKDATETIIAALKERARITGRSDPVAPGAPLPMSSNGTGSGAASALAIPKEKRLRDKNHLTFVARQPCLVCGRRPAQAHHLRFAQPRAMALKVSDEFTVPLCNSHHDSLHRTGDEKAWWAQHGVIDPLKFAERLWAASRQHEPIDEVEPEPHTPDPTAGGAPPTGLGPANSQTSR